MPVLMSNAELLGLSARATPCVQGGQANCRDLKIDAKHKLAETIERVGLEKRSKKIKFLTYHSSKGLQVDAVFLLGDCDITSSSPSKNDFYAQAGMGSPTDPFGCDTAQQQEAFIALLQALKGLGGKV